MKGKRIMILVERDFQDLEVLYPYYRLKEEGCEVIAAGGGEKTYKGKNGNTINADGHVKDYSAKDFDAVIIPGGWAPDFMRRIPDFVRFVKDMNAQSRIIASICHGGWLLASAGIVKGRTVTSFIAIKDDLVHAGAKFVDKEVVVDGNIITSRKPEDLPAFCKEIIKALNK